MLLRVLCLDVATSILVRIRGIRAMGRNDNVDSINEHSLSGLLTRSLNLTVVVDCHCGCCRGKLPLVGVMRSVTCPLER